MFQRTLGICLIVCGLCFAGLTLNLACDANGKIDLSQVATLNDKAHATTQATTQRIAEVEATLSALPANDPGRRAVETQLQQLRDSLAKVNDVLAKGDAFIEAANKGNVQPLINATTGIPYAGLVITLGSLGWTWYQKNQHQQAAAAANEEADNLTKALTQVVHSVEEALPAKTDAQKAAMNEVQDSDTRALVEQVKSGA